ncbi:ABC transporter ATP-binding protein [bacterium]|nr:ABC transporter ATP-binding protein [bacterium]
METTPTVNDLTVKDLSVTLGGRVILEDISFNLEANSFVGIIGPNGAGKSVFLKTLLGLITPSTGTIEIFGKSVTAARGLIGYVPQFASFDRTFPITVRAVVEMSTLALKTLSAKEKRDRVEESLKRLELESLSKREIGKISGGELQRTLIARALVLKPKLLLLDEPTANLDLPRGQGLYQLLEELAQELSIILVSHDIGVIAKYVKTIACLNKCLHFHGQGEIPHDVFEKVYGCPIELLAHAHPDQVHPHRVLGPHAAHQLGPDGKPKGGCC